MEITKGMYVRTEEGKIFKTDGDKFYLSNNKKIFYRLLSRIPHESASYKVTKASYNIIDLIEVGDYVNGEEVYGKGFGKILLKGLNDIYYIDNRGIKSIVTKEQFESMEYRI